MVLHQKKFVSGNMIAQIAYTNSNCSDLWEMFTSQIQKHTKMPLYLISDVIPKNLKYVELHQYLNEEPYYKVWIDAVNKFGSTYFIYLQEDFILNSDVSDSKIDEYVQFLVKYPEYSFVRLIKSGKLYDKKITDTLYEVESTNINIFAMQATIWRSVDYIKLMNSVHDSKWLENDNYRNAMIAMNMKGVYHYDGEPKRGSNHSDSNIYPYVATALVRSKWNMSEYSNQLSTLLNEYNIDANKRGII